jgi:DNA helicase-2/ATP-dependent DNA helicase PcrA
MQAVTMQPLDSPANADDDRPPYLARLNPEQQSAVQATEGPVLVLAGAGTGKTRVLTTRIAHILITKRAFTGQILAVTFTNKAAAEMRERVQDLMGMEENTGGLWLGTFHSIGAKILRRHAELVGLTPQFTILDDDDQQRLIKQLLQAHNIDHQKFPPRAVLGMIQGWKDRGYTADKIPSSAQPHTLDGVAATLYPIYQARLKALNCCDFGDLLLHNLTIFQAHPNVLEEYSTRFRYILVDEYQDTNTAQYMWLRLLAIAHKNLCCVGDDDQSIYGWRGAEVGNILKFEQDYPGATIIRLERNYRSTAPILKAASAVISNNQSRLGKTLWTEDEGGAPIRIKSVWDDGEEARYVGEEIEAMQRDGIRLQDMAVLVRTGFQTRSFEERFLTLAIPYRVIGGLRFYERREVRDAVAYLRVIQQPKDDLAFERIINTPKRGIGKVTMEGIHAHARAHNCSMAEAIAARIASADIKGKQASTLSGLMKQFDTWRANMAERTLAELADMVLEASGYRTMWQNDSSPEAAGRLENLKELVRALEDFPNLEAFLEHVGLVTDGAAQAGDDMVSIMSLHAAKGLEFDVVFLTGWEEGLFPSQRTLDESGSKGLEEERRLAYVGITRARKHLYVSHAANRRIYNQWQSALPSRFLAEIPEDCCEALEGGPYNHRATGPALFQREMDSILQARTPAPPPEAETGFRKGSKVQHASFGFGVILHIEGDHIQVAFKHAGVKKLLADYLEPA